MENLKNFVILITILASIFGGYKAYKLIKRLVYKIEDLIDESIFKTQNALQLFTLIQSQVGPYILKELQTRTMNIINDIANNKTWLTAISKQVGLPEVEILEGITKKLLADMGNEYYRYLMLGTPNPEPIDHVYAIGMLIGKYFNERK